LALSPNPFSSATQFAGILCVRNNDVPVYEMLQLACPLTLGFSPTFLDFQYKKKSVVKIHNGFIDLLVKF